ncbi:uncharacterized protein RCH25_006592 [Pelodytes ibericus]
MASTNHQTETTEKLQLKCQELESQITLLKQERNDLLKENRAQKEVQIQQNRMNNECVSEEGISPLKLQIQQLQEEKERLEMTTHFYKSHCEELELKLLQSQHRSDQLESMAFDAISVKDDIDILRDEKWSSHSLSEYCTNLAMLKVPTYRATTDRVTQLENRVEIFIRKMADLKNWLKLAKSMQEVNLKQFSMECSVLMLVVIGNWVVSGVTLSISQCPDRCTCHQSVNYILCNNASLTVIPSQFDNNTVELDLHHNNFAVLNASFVRDMPQLRSLFLSSCNVSTIQSGAFQDVSSIQYLYLDNNELTDLENGSFSNLSKLLYLHLERNKIRYLHPGIFATLKKLSALYLSHNLLSKLSDLTLDGLIQLRWLDLGFNNLSDILTSSFYYPKNLRRLNLEMNNFTQVPPSVRSIRGLQMLRLSGNNITQLSSVSFGRKLSSLTKLYLDRMGLETVTSLAFNKMRMLEVLDLRNNNLQSLSVNRVKISTEIYLTGNPWRCDCSIILLHTRLKLRKQKDPEQQAQCLSPTALEGQNLININLPLLTCPAFGEDIVNTTTLPMPEISKITQPSMYPVAPTVKTTTMDYKTLSTTHLLESTATFSTSRNIIVDLWDPCLSDHISNISVITLGEESLEVSWSVSGYYKQFELRYSAAEERAALNVIGELKQVQLFNLNPGTTYKVCIVPQNRDILKCQSPKPWQCAFGETDISTEQAHPVYSTQTSTTSPFVTIGVSVAVVVLVAFAIVITYTLRSHNTNFQRYYNEDEAEGSKRQGFDAYKLDGIEEDTDERRHVYVTASSSWGTDNEKLDCSLAEPVSLSSVPKYITL